MINAGQNWWGNADLGIINTLIFDRSDSLSLGLWVDFGSPWLDPLGASVFSQGIIGQLDSQLVVDEERVILGYSETTGVVVIGGAGSLKIANGALLKAEHDIKVAIRATLALEPNAKMVVGERSALIINADASLRMAPGAQVEIFGQLKTLAQPGQPIVLPGGDPVVCN